MNESESLIESGVDVLVVDSAHGHSANVMRHGQGDQTAVGYRCHCRQRSNTGGMRADLIKGGRRRGQGRHWSRLDLHDASYFGSRCPTDHSRFTKPRRRRRKQNTVIADGGIRFSGDINKGDRCRCSRCDDRRLVRRTRRESRKNDPVPRSDFQGVPRHGVARSDGQRFQRALPPIGRSSGNGKLVPEGVEGRVPFKGPLSDLCVSVGWWVTCRNGLLRHGDD